MPTRIEGLISANKALHGVPVWRERNRDALDFSVPLEIEGVTVEALTLRGHALKSIADRDLIFQLEYHHALIIGGPVARIEWHPLRPHSNRGLGPKEFRHIIQDKSHHHRFDLNWRHSKDGVLRG